MIMRENTFFYEHETFDSFDTWSQLIRFHLFELSSCIFLVRLSRALYLHARNVSSTMCVRYNKKKINKNLPISVDFLTHFGAPFSLLQYSFCPQTIEVQLASANSF